MAQSTFEQQLSWTTLHMTRMRDALSRLPDLHGMRLACSMHLDLKMVPLISGLRERGAELFVVTCNPTTVRPQAVEAMRRVGAEVVAWPGMPTEDYQAAVVQALNWQPSHLCELGADLSLTLAQQVDLQPISQQIKAALEGTGSGINRLKTIDLPYPVFNWDDLPVKEGLHNRHMVGLTTWQTFFARTKLSLHEKKVLVIGYGSVGQGIATVARCYGGNVSVADLDPLRQIEARYAGWPVVQVAEFIPEADVIVTATGAEGVIGESSIHLLKDGVFLLNCGHQDTEIDTAALRRFPSTEVLPFIEAFRINGRTIYLLAGGSMFNLTAGEGDSLNAFDVTVAVLVAGIGHIAGAGANQPAGIQILPRSVWQSVI